MVLRKSRTAVLLLYLAGCHVHADDAWSTIETHKRLRQYREAANALEPLCQRNDARACRELAQFYRNGLGVARDLGKSAALLKTGADRGDRDAQYQLGVMLANGSSGHRDIAQARHYLTQAAAGGDRKAAEYLRTLPAASERDDTPSAVTRATPLPPEKKREARTTATPAEATAANAAQLQSAAQASGVPALTLAIERGNLALTRQALATTPDAWAIDTQGHTPITRAALYNKPDVLQYLLTQSRGKGLVGANARNALFHAIDGNSAQSIAPLLAAGIGTTTTDANGVTAVDHALQHRSALATTLLAATPRAQWQAHWLPLAAEHGDQAFCLQLIDAGVALDARDRHAHTALWHAVSRNDATLVKILLAKGADTSIKDNTGNTLLHIAARHASPRISDALIPHFKAQQRIDSRNDAGDTPLHLASAAGASATLEHLLAAGADKDLRGSAGNTALMLAVSAHHLQAIDTLLAAGVDLAPRNDNKKNALGIAEQLGYRDIEARLRDAAERRGIMSIFQ